MKKPTEEHRAWGDMIRTVAAICTVAISIGLLAGKLGIW